MTTNKQDANRAECLDRTPKESGEARVPDGPGVSGASISTTSDSARSPNKASVSHFASKSCQGEVCRFSIIDTSGVKVVVCGDPARHKVEEEIFHDDPNPVRHPLTAYLCCFHYSRVMGQVCRG